MKFKIDENMPTEAAELLRDAGHDATTVGEERLLGSPDETLAERAQREQRAFVTMDMDFADIRAYPPDEYAGIIVLRLPVQLRPLVLGLVRRLVPLLQTESLRGCLWIVGPGRVRIFEGTAR